MQVTKIITNIDLNEKQFNDLFVTLPDWRKQKIYLLKNINDKILSTRTYLLLEEILINKFGIKDIPEFSYNKYGKPFLQKYPDISFNLSHSHNAVMCVVSDEAEIGCDIEKIKESLDDKLLKKILNEDEYKDVITSNNSHYEFTKYWTLKESYLKMIGTGIVADIKTTLNPNRNDKYNASFQTNTKDGYVWSVCMGTKI